MSNLSLYEITNAFPTLMESEEITEEDKNKIKAELTINAMKEEEKRIAENRKSLESKLDKFKQYVKENMERLGITKMETELGTLSIAKNPLSVEIENEDEIPEEFKQEIVTTKIDKTAIKNHFKETGEVVSGVQIVDDKTSLRIK